MNNTKYKKINLVVHVEIKFKNHCFKRNLANVSVPSVPDQAIKSSVSASANNTT